MPLPIVAGLAFSGASIPHSLTNCIAVDDLEARLCNRPDHVGDWCADRALYLQPVDRLEGIDAIIPLLASAADGCLPTGVEHQGTAAAAPIIAHAPTSRPTRSGDTLSL